MITLRNGQVAAGRRSPDGARHGTCTPRESRGSVPAWGGSGRGRPCLTPYWRAVTVRRGCGQRPGHRTGRHTTQGTARVDVPESGRWRVIGSASVSPTAHPRCRWPGGVAAGSSMPPGPQVIGPVPRTSRSGGMSADVVLTPVTSISTARATSTGRGSPSAAACDDRPTVGHNAQTHKVT